MSKFLPQKGRRGDVDDVDSVMRDELEELLYVVRAGVLVGLMRGLQKVAKVHVDGVVLGLRASDPVLDLFRASFLDDELKAFGDGAKVKESLKQGKARRFE